MTTTLRFPISKVGAALAALVLALAAPLAWAQAKNAVESVNFATVQGGKIQVKVGLKEPLAAEIADFAARWNLEHARAPAKSRSKAAR